MTEATLQRTTTAPGLIRDWLQLSKARIVVMILLTTAAGFLLASSWPPDAILLLHTLVATALVAAGTNALNQYAEREYDGLMERTRTRPLPAGRLSERTALIGSTAAAVVGTLWLGVAVNWLAALLAALTLITYLFVYTPLKRVTPWSTLVGSFPGAIPPLIGWAAVRGQLDLAAWLAFAILFLWQMPHFFAIGWLYRDDYSRAGFAILSVQDPTGSRSGRQAVVYSVLLLVISLLPWVFGICGDRFLAGALLSGGAMLLAAISFGLSRTRGRAGALFALSIVYLPVVLSLMVLDRTA